MSEDLRHADDPRLADLAKHAAMLQWPLPRFRDPHLCGALARSIDVLLAKVARGRGALDISIGEHLDALDTAGRVLRLGYVSVNDYSREMLGIPASTAQKMARFARNLRECPQLREAVRSGEVSVRQAQAVLPVARGEAEAYWVARARKGETVRRLKAAVNHPGGIDPDEDEQWDRLCTDVPPDRLPPLREALGLAGQALGGSVSRWQRLGACLEEYVGAHATSDVQEPVPAVAVDDWMESAKEWLEEESKNWGFLAQVDPVPVAEPIPEAHADPHLLHEKLTQLCRDREQWDGVFGHLAMLAHRARAWFHLD